MLSSLTRSSNEVRFGTGRTAQTEKYKETQVKNSAGGYTFEITDISRLKRFLILGTERGTYYSSEEKLNKENVKSVFKLIKEKKGKEVLEIVKDYSVNGRVHKQEPLLFVYAACCRSDDQELKKEAYSLLPLICRIPTHLFTFISFCETLSMNELGKGTGWGKAHKRAVSKWYNDKEPKDLTFTVTKYKSRGNWSHRDVLRLAHPKPKSDFYKLLYKYITKESEIDRILGETLTEESEMESYYFLQGLEKIRTETDVTKILTEMRKYKYAREHLPTTCLGSKEIWEELLKTMGLTALLRNLGKMTSIGLISNENPEVLNLITNKLTQESELQKARIHPLNVLLALSTYKSGKGFKGKLSWGVVPRIVDTLDKTFYKSFKYLESTGKRYLLALDISGSMEYNNIPGSSLTCRDATAALSMAVSSSEENVEIVGFSHNLINLDITHNRRLDDNINTISNLPFGSTDCALPMSYALEKGLKKDIFVIFTDNETYYGKVHPAQELKNYRKKMGIDAKLIVVAMTSTNFSIADSEDPGMLDIPGFDADLPRVIAEFSKM